MKTYFVIFTILLQHYVNAIGDIVDVDQGDYVQAYNSLPSIEEAGTLISQEDFLEFLRDHKKIVKEYGYEDFYGLRLLHKHMELRKGEAMVEKFSAISGVPSLITQPTHISAYRRGQGYAASWIIQEDNTLAMFEASQDPVVYEKGALFLKNKLFLSAVTEHLQSYQLEGKLAFSVQERSGISLKDGEVFVEKTELLEGSLASYIQVKEKKDIDFSSYVPTSWSFKGEITHACPMYTICPIDDDGNHSGWGVKYHSGHSSGL